MRTELEHYTRDQLDNYMIDCHGFEPEQLQEYETEDLISDIRTFGWEKECKEYLI